MVATFESALGVCDPLICVYDEALRVFFVITSLWVANAIYSWNQNQFEFYHRWSGIAQIVVNFQMISISICMCWRQCDHRICHSSCITFHSIDSRVGESMPFWLHYLRRIKKSTQILSFIFIHLRILCASIPFIYHYHALVEWVLLVFS